MLTAEKPINPNPARALYENFMTGEYGKKWDDLPAGVQKRWADALAAGVIAMTSVRIEPVEDFDTGALRAASLQPGTIAVLPEPTDIIFSDGEPYAAITVDYLGCEYLSRDVENIEKIAAAGSKGPTEVVYLFRGTRSKSPSPKPVEPLALPYKNWRGEISTRKILPIRLEFSATEWHPEPQWLLIAIDVEKNVERSFALKDFNPPTPASPVTSKAAEIVTSMIKKSKDDLFERRQWGGPTIGADQIEHRVRAYEDVIAVLSAQVQDVAGLERLRDVTYAVQHNPNCPAKYLVRLVGKSGRIDLKPYGNHFPSVKHETGDVLGFGKTLDEAIDNAIAAAAPAKQEGGE
ncbi:hypothetical protein [Agrobacterium tumefaciens]|uniref:hypothetical protein n=1 Tax=Agrobacterium tumefaciens TaxID=358 RepID=UPI0021D159B6|nr:hypothetical protein [Agrobacterium tumefaciens]